MALMPLSLQCNPSPHGPTISKVMMMVSACITSKPTRARK